MFRKPLRTYDRKNNRKANISSIWIESSTSHFNSVESKNTKEKKILDETLEDPFDTTFDRLLKDFRSPPPPPNHGLSYISSSIDISDPSSLSSDSEDVKWKSNVPKKKARLKHPNSKTSKRKPRSVKEKTAVETDKNKIEKSIIKASKKKTDQEKITIPVKRKRRRRIKSDSEDSITDFVILKKPSIPQNSSKDDPCVHSNSILENFSISQPLDNIYSPHKDSVNNNELENVNKIQRSTSNTKKSKGKSKKSSLKESSHSKGSFSSKRSSHSIKTDSVISSKIISCANLKACSVVLERCDWMLKKKDVFNLKPCSIQIPRLNIPSNRKSKSPISQDVRKKTANEAGKKSKKKSVKEPEEALRKNQDNEFRKNNSRLEESNSSILKLRESVVRKSHGNESPIAFKDCVVTLTRMRPSKTSFLDRLVSSTPFVRQMNRKHLPDELSQMSLEISNITSTPNSPLIKSSIISRPHSAPCLQLEDVNKSKNNNSKSNLISKPTEFNSESWNYSTDYSEIDWTTVSLSDSQCVENVTLQDGREVLSPGKQMSKLKSISVESSKKDSSAAKNLTANRGSSKTIDLATSENLDASTEPFKFVNKRNLKLNQEYEKSMSLFDDTKLSEDDLIPSLKKLSSLKVDEKSITKSPPIHLLRKISSSKESFTSSSILNQTDLKGFDDQEILKPNMKKLSPMTSIPTSIVHSFSFENLEKSDSLVEDIKMKNEKTKLLRSLAFEKTISLSGLKSPRKCLNFDEELKIGSDNVNSDSISSNENSFNEKSIDGEFFHKESFHQDSLNKDSFSQDSQLSNTTEILLLNDDEEKKANKKDEVRNSLENNNQNSFEDNSSQDTTEILLLDDGEEKEANTKDEVRNSLENNNQKSFENNSSQDSVEDDDSQKTVKYEYPEMLRVGSDKILENESEELNSETEAVNTSKIEVRKSIISLNRLKDPIRITQRRKKYRDWGMQLTTILENKNRRLSNTEVETSSLAVDDKVDPVREDASLICDKVYEAGDVSLDNSKEVKIPSQQLFLKPGKSWARSLSILYNIHSKEDVDKLSVGKGKKWRNSVLNILDMQSKGIVKSCLRQKDDPKSPQACEVLNGNVDNDLKIERLTTFGSFSPNRFVKRISIRVVPDPKKFNNVEDTQFLEAYGITSNHSTKTFSQRFSSLQENKTILESQEALVYNVQLEDSVLKTSDSAPLVTAKDVVLERCCQRDYLSFAKCYPETFLRNCRKIGEGVYGEVFLNENASNTSVIKIIPIEGNDLVNGEPQKKFHEILSEIVIAKELHDLRFNEKYNTSAFVEVKSIKCIIGKYPPKLIELWKLYDDEKKSENDCPSMFDNNQLYISLELGHGGQDLEAFVFQNAKESYAVFIQTAIALAVAEQSLEFEHRDLHWGNVLISKTKKSQVSYKLGNREINIASGGVKVAIIDFTLSRMSYQGCCIFNDLALDPALFTAEGEYQFEIYRLMRDKMGNDWKKFEPFTNILWLHYTLDKMIMLVRYKKKTTKVHKAAIESLQRLKNQILSYDSAYDLVTKCNEFTSLYNDQNSSVD